MTAARDVDAVCFDLDETLCVYERDGAEILSEAFDLVGVDHCWEMDAYVARYRDHLEASDDMADLRRRCFEELALEAGHGRETGRAVAAAYSELRNAGGVEPLPGAREVVTALGEEYRLGLITNGAPRMQRAKLETLGLEEQFDTAVFAGYDTAAKPAAEPFEVALDRLGIAPDRAVYVGNSLSSDVAGARAAGLESVWIPHGGSIPERIEPTPDYRLGSIEELATTPWSSIRS